MSRDPAKRVAYPNRDIDLIIRQTYEKLSALFIKVHNLGVEVSELRATQKKLISVVLALLADPQAQHELEAIARDLRIQTFKKE